MHKEKAISIIVAIAENGVIGDKNDLLWHIPEDFKYFKKTTLDHTIVMGRKTWNSLQIRPLPKRKNIVITSNKTLQLEGASIAHSIDEALSLCDDAKETFIIGGGEIYRQFLPLAQKLYITHIHKIFEGETSFPEVDFSKYTRISCEKFHDDKSELDYSIAVYQRQ